MEPHGWLGIENACLMLGGALGFVRHSAGPTGQLRNMSIMFYHLITFYISRRYVGCNMYAPSHDAGMIAWGWISVVIRQGITASPMSTR